MRNGANKKKRTAAAAAAAHSFASNVLAAAAAAAGTKGLLLIRSDCPRLSFFLSFSLLSLTSIISGSH